tara:strand:- start:48 stop:950 length:903 start_codon:yes stop_codon:yes gene_type:complete
MKLSIFGTSEIINHHIQAAKKNSFEIFSICTSNKNSKNIFKLAKKYKIKNVFFNWKNFILNSYLNNCSVLIAGRIKDNKKILTYALKHNLKILIEKPIFITSKEFNKYLKFKKNIFVGYNRIYFHNVIELKKIVSNNAPHNLLIKCPETKKRNIELNTCHIISIVYFLFGRVNLIKKIKSKESIFCIFETKKKIPIYFNINFRSPDNFSFELNFTDKRIKLEPIEILIIFNKLIKKKYKNNIIYTPSPLKISSEFKLTKLKPGFELQYQNFKRFIKNQKSNFINIEEAKEIILTCNKITN